jgi:hypothetical protein
MKGPMIRPHTLITSRLAVIVVCAALLSAVPFHAALAATAPSLGSAASFAVLGSSTVTNTGPTTVTGDLGVSPGSAVTGFPPGSVTGTTYTGSGSLAGPAQSDAAIAYSTLASTVSNPCNTNLTGAVLGMVPNATLGPGVYCFNTSAQLTGTLTLSGAGLYIFQIGSTLTTASLSSITLTNGAAACDVWWQVGSSATLGTGTSLAGNVLALTSITLTTGANVSGGVFALNGAVTMDTNQVSVCGNTVPSPTATSTPTRTPTPTFTRTPTRTPTIERDHDKGCKDKDKGDKGKEKGDKGKDKDDDKGCKDKDKDHDKGDKDKDKGNKDKD